MTSLRYYVIVIGLCLCAVGSFAQTSEMEQRYQALSARFDGRDKLLQRDLKAYLQAYPYTTFADEVKFMQGVLQVERGHYKQSLKILEQVEAKALSRPHQTDYSFYRGYAYLMMQEYQRASVYFGQLGKGDSRYSSRGNYYHAYHKTVPYYITQIYYAQKNYEEAGTRAEDLLRENPESPNNGELHRIIGEMHYAKKEYSAAVEHLRAYQKNAKEQKEELLRSDMYMLGCAEYELGEFDAAVKSLKQVKQEKDVLSETAYA